MNAPGTRFTLQFMVDSRLCHKDYELFDREMPRIGESVEFQWEGRLLILEVTNVHHVLSQGTTLVQLNRPK